MGRYAAGQKRCQICEIYMLYNGLDCPCCGYRLRTKPRRGKYKAQLVKAKQTGNIVSYGIKMEAV